MDPEDFFDDDDGYNNYHHQDYDDPLEYEQEMYTEQNQPSYQMGDYGFEKRLEENMEMFEPKDFFNFESHARSEKIRKFTTSEQIFMILTETNRVFRWEIEYNQLRELIIPGGNEAGSFSRDSFGGFKNAGGGGGKGQAVVERIFLDQKGVHCLICTSRGDNYYVNKQSDKVKLLKNFRERIRSAIIDNQSTNELVKVACGTHDGKLFYFNIEVSRSHEINDMPAKLVTDKLKTPIFHMDYFTYIQQEGMKENHHRVIFVLTGYFLFFFTGPKDFSQIFEKYISRDPNTYTGLPILLKNRKSPLVSFCITNKGIGQSLIVSDGNSILLCRLPEKTDRADFYPFAKMQTLKYAKKELHPDEKEQLKILDPPIAIVCSQYHYYILHKESLTILSTINEKVVGYYEGKELCDTGKAQGMFIERGGDNIYIYDSHSIRTISFAREGIDVWGLYLDNKQYQEAYDICKRTRSSNLPYVAGLFADNLFASGKYELAADKYIESSRTFEEICLKFLMKDNLSALERYLYYIQNTKLVSKSKMRKAILFSWVLEQKLYVLNEKERLAELLSKTKDDEKREKEKAQKTFLGFMENSQKNLNVGVTYSLLQSHGRFKEFMTFADKKEKYEDMILHYIHEGEYDEALSTLERLFERGLLYEERNGQPEEESKKSSKMNKMGEHPFEIIKSLMYNRCHILMKKKPDQILRFLNKKDDNNKRIINYELAKILPGFMNVPYNDQMRVVEFLREDCVENPDFKERSIHNIYILFMAQHQYEMGIYEYLNKQEELLKKAETEGGPEARDIPFDSEFALNCFQRRDLIRAELQLIGMMGLLSEAVELALENNMIEEAKSFASKPEGETEEIKDYKKRLWLQIALHLIKSDQTDIVIKLVEESNEILHIEDLLPHFNDGFRIELFKDEISDSLKSYVEKIKKLKDDLSLFERNSEVMKGELSSLKNRCFELKGDEQCEECQRTVFGEEFFLFPCKHFYHKECIKKKMISANIYPEKVREVEILENEIERMKLESVSNPSSKASSFLIPEGGKSKKHTDSFLMNKNISMLSPPGDNEKKIKEKEKRIDFLLASDCLACGKYLIDFIPLGLSFDDAAMKAWAL